MEKWLVTGASSGLGLAIAKEALEQGAYVYATFRQLAQAAAYSQQYAGRGLGLVMNLSDAASIQEAVAQVGELDVLVNNAGLGMAGAIEETSMAEARRLFEVNFFGTLRLTQLLLPQLRAQRRGHIVQISSHGGIKAFAGFGLYNASKFALEGMSEAMAQELAPLGIRVSLVEPGPFRTQFAGPGFVQAENRIADYQATAGTFREKIAAVHGQQEGDPAKAAKAIGQLVHRADPPLRLPLGKTALMTIQTKLDQVQTDLDAARELASQAIFGP
ncbi:MAG: oxidoreductase [Bacteroidetes bacterium]|nr:oxidoreductase [Bacteroidota bacterium]